MKMLFIKVLRDLLKDKKRTFLAILSIIIGTTAFGGILFSYILLNRELVEMFKPVNLSSANVVVTGIDDNFLKLTRDFEGISEFEEKAYYKLRFKASQSEWFTLHLYAAKDFSKMQINRVSSISGNLQPKKNEILLERGSLKVVNTFLNDKILIGLADSDIHELNVAGIVHDITLPPASMHNIIIGYVNFDTLAELGLSKNRMFSRTDRVGIS